MKRFYKQAAYKKDGGTYSLHLDDKSVKTPLGNVFFAPNDVLAQMVCDEWNAQGDAIMPDSMPVYGILITAIDKGTGQARKEIINHMRDYIDGDLLSYQTKTPPELATRQQKIWGNAIDIFTGLFQTTPNITYDIQAINQPEPHINAIEDYINSLDQWGFTVFHILVSVTGSPILAILAMNQKLSANEILEIILTEDRFYQEKYTKLGHEPSKDETQKEVKLQMDIDACLSIARSI